MPAPAKLYLDDTGAIGGSIQATNIGRSTAIVTGIRWAWTAASRFDRRQALPYTSRHSIIKPADEVQISAIRGLQLDDQQFIAGAITYSDPFGDHTAWFVFELEVISGEETLPATNVRLAKGGDWPADT